MRELDQSILEKLPIANNVSQAQTCKPDMHVCTAQGQIRLSNAGDKQFALELSCLVLTLTHTLKRNPDQRLDRKGYNCTKLC